MTVFESSRSARMAVFDRFRDVYAPCVEYGRKQA
jgi:hypothetical protein